MRTQEDAEIELFIAARDKTNVALLAEMERYAKEFPGDKKTLIWWQAFIECRYDNFQTALNLYSALIAAEEFACTPSRMSRAGLYLSLRQFPRALADINACLADHRPIPVERFHLSLKFERALILAVTRDPEFETAIQEIPADYSEVRFKERRDVSNLIDLYKGKTELPPPKA